MLNLTLQAGLTALKTTLCSQLETKNLNCPVCLPQFNFLSQKLPNGHHVNSSLVCFVSGKIMDESNPPYVLPNGYCYSWLALKEMDSKFGIVRCPRTNTCFQLSEARKAFIS
jgi:macrophage erythroblast attacher